jgi:molybdopterin molybdotransferase
MITVVEARTIILEQVRPTPAEQVDLSSALGRTLRERVTATRAQPPFPAAAMDGYAVRSGDTPGVLRCIGEAGAGRSLQRPLAAGECARIFTGAPLPNGADAVLMQEDAVRDGDRITAPRVEHAKHMRGVGVDFSAGAHLLEPGRLLDGPALALAAAAGCARLSVSKKPRLVILSGGNEIVPPGAHPEADQIYDSVSFGVAGLAETWGASSVRNIPFVDDAALIARHVNEALADADLAVVIGGASVGDHDHARPALRAIGAELLFEKVALRPGKPTWFARRDRQLVLGLPGNPASAFVCARLLLRPLLDRMLGRDPAASVKSQTVRSRDDLTANGARESYLRAHIDADEAGQLWARVPPNQDSSLISVFAACNALLIREPNAASISAGDTVRILPL